MSYVESTASAAWSTASFNITDANLQQRWQDFHDTITGAGLVELNTETGRLSPFSGATPNINGESFYGFRIYRFNDTLQATRPIYLRVDFGATRSGTGANTNYAPVFKINLGCGTDGAGTLTGSTWGPFYIDGNQGSTFSSAQLRATYSNTSSCFAVVLTSANSADGFVVERLRDAAGAPTNAGFYIQGVATARSAGQVYGVGILKSTSSTAFTFGRTTYSTAASSGQPATLNPQSATTSLTFDSNTGILLHYPLTHRPYAPCLSVVTVSSGDFASDVTINTTRYGNAQSYKALNNTVSSLPGQVGISGSSRLALWTTT